MIVDVNAFFGAYPWRRVPGTTPEHIIEAMDRVGIDAAWMSHLPAMYWRDPMAGNDDLFAAAATSDRLRPVPAIHPGLPAWRQELARVAARSVPAVRCDPTHYSLDPAGTEVADLIGACAAAHIPLMAAVRLEDSRQRHPHDHAPDLTAAAVRGWLRLDPNLRLIVTHADRAFIEEVHFGSTTEESGRLWWDICWVWGPPEDHLQLLLDTIGVDRFVFGTGQPLRLPEAALAKLDLLDLAAEDRDRITGGEAVGL